MPVLGSLEPAAPGHHHARLRKRHALRCGRSGRELYEGELLRGYVGVQLLGLDLLRERGHERQRRVVLASDLHDVRLAQLLGLRGDLERDAAEIGPFPLGDDQRLHRTFASSRSAVASCCAICLASPSLRILPPPRTGGGSIERTVQVGPDASTPSALNARSGISFFFAFMIPGSDGYLGSF